VKVHSTMVERFRATGKAHTEVVVLSSVGIRDTFAIPGPIQHCEKKTEFLVIGLRPRCRYAAISALRLVVLLTNRGLPLLVTLDIDEYTYKPCLLAVRAGRY